MEYNENILKTEYSDIMKRSYIDYAMSVIVARALPDVRDGLKPVQRRTLYDMHELGIKWDKPYRKSARIVGDTMGKYHPHGDSSIYESLVVMSQDFKKILPLVDGHGNFGSIEGDGAAAMRYTEARLSKITQDVYLSDLDKNVVDFMPNFDESEKEPVVLPVRIPNLLVNGAEGIAVGMATSIPTHNLGEVCDAVIAYIKNGNITTKGLIHHITGPDFPTGGIITNKDDLKSIYETGQGKIKIRGKVDIEKAKGGKEQIVISEIPYTMVGLGITKFLNDVANLIETKKITDITDISNQSSKEGIRIVLELKKGADANNIINILYKKTKLEDTFGVNMLAVADGKPETLSLKDIIEHNVNFQFELCNKKYTTLLAKEENKKEIQEGLIKACDVIDLIIEILRGSKNLKQAKDCLVNGVVDGIKFKSDNSAKLAKILLFTEVQANAILDMKLSKLIGLEILALKAEHEKTLENIKTYKDILNNYETMANVIINDIKSIKKEFSMPRKTVIDNVEEVQIIEKSIEEEEIYFLMDRFGYAKTIDLATFERNKEAVINENKYYFPVLNVGKVGVFTNTGKLHTIKMLKLPNGKFRDKGQPIDNVSNFKSSEEIAVHVSDIDNLRFGKLLFVTKSGLAKIVEAKDLIGSNKTVVATKLNDNDEVVYVGFINEFKQIIIGTNNNKFIRFNASEIPEQGKVAKGVKTISLSDNDYVKMATVVDESISNSFEYDNKEIKISKVKLAKRGGKGNKI